MLLQLVEGLQGKASSEGIPLLLMTLSKAYYKQPPLQLLLFEHCSRYCSAKLLESSYLSCTEASHMPAIAKAQALAHSLPCFLTPVILFFQVRLDGSNNRRKTFWVWKSLKLSPRGLLSCRTPFIKTKFTQFLLLSYSTVQSLYSLILTVYPKFQSVILVSMSVRVAKVASYIAYRSASSELSQDFAQFVLYWSHVRDVQALHRKGSTITRSKQVKTIFILISIRNKTVIYVLMVNSFKIICYFLSLLSYKNGVIFFPFFYSFVMYFPLFLFIYFHFRIYLFPNFAYFMELIYFINYMKKADQTHLAKTNNGHKQLIQQIQKQLSAIQANEKDQDILKLRLKLIEDCGELSVVRIEHLQQIFKHYCTHIFKTGKHMTFQRLQYERVHLTMDRFCVFLKDFGLTSASIEGQTEEVLDKQEIVKYFKRHSQNCRDLGFQQFVSCLEKLSVVYYDEKQSFKEKQIKQKQDRDKRIAEYKKRMKQKQKQKAQREEGTKKNQNIEGDEQKQAEEQKGENDDLVKNMMDDQDIEDPNEEIKKAALGDEPSQQQQKISKKTKISKIKKTNESVVKGENRPIYQLTVQEKIQYFYQLIGVDNVQDFRKKMSELNLPLFQHYKPKKSVSTKQSNQINVIIEENQKQDKRRLIELRQKLNMKKQRDKSLHSPVMSKEDYEERKRKRGDKQMQMMREGAESESASRATVLHQPTKKKVDLTEKQMSLDMLNHISFDDLKHKFNPTKYFSVDDSDPIFMGEYGPEISKVARKPAKSNFRERQKTSSTLDFKKRNSSNIVEDLKKRAFEMQAKQFSKQAQMSRFVNKLKQNKKKPF